MNRTPSGEHAINEKEMMSAKGYLQVSEVAARIGKSVYTVYGWISASRLKESVKIGSRHYVLWAEVFAFYREQDPKAVELLGLTEQV